MGHLYLLNILQHFKRPPTTATRASRGSGNDVHLAAGHFLRLQLLFPFFYVFCLF